MGRIFTNISLLIWAFVILCAITALGMLITSTGRSLGISFYSAVYFVGALALSLWMLSKSPSAQKSYMTLVLYGLPFLALAMLGLQDLGEWGAPSEKATDTGLGLDAHIRELQLVMVYFFMYAVPAGVNLIYASLYSEDRKQNRLNGQRSI